MKGINKKYTKSSSPRYGNKVRYLVIHWVGAVSTAKNNADYFARVNPLASAHYFVDAKEMWASVPTERAAWSVGGGMMSSKGGKFFGKCNNLNSVSVELCCIRKNGKVIVDPAAIKKATPLVRALMKRLKISPDRVIRHFDVNGKMCPGGYCDNGSWKKLHKQLTGC